MAKKKLLLNSSLLFTAHVSVLDDYLDKLKWWEVSSYGEFGFNEGCDNNN